MKTGDSSELDFTEEIEAEKRQVRAWANNTEELGTVSNLLNLVARRRTGLTKALTAGLKDMNDALREIYRGNITSDIWELTLTLEQGGGDSSGTRNYVLAIGDQGIRAQCHGSEWVRDEGSDSWTGADFFFSPDKTRENGDYLSFINEFENAICQTQDYDLRIEKNGDSISSEDDEIEESATIARHKLSSGLVRRVIRELQQMQDPSMLLSGEDSGLRDVWDEICVQRQTEESFCWAAYEETMRALIGGTLDDYSHNQLVDLWLLTEPGEDWQNDNPDEKRPAPSKSDVIEYVLSALLSKAENHSNARIRAHIERSTRSD